MPVLDEFMKQLGYEMELETPLEPEMSGVYLIPLDEGLRIVVNRIDNGLSLTCELADCPTIKREEFLQTLMEANLFGQGTSNSILGLSSNSKKITLSHHIERDIKYNEFAEILEDFINTIDFWREEARNFK